MNPRDYTFTFTASALQDWIKATDGKAHSMAVKYIEENVDLLDTDLQKFMDDCPYICSLEVYNMLLEAGIDMKGYSLKQWEDYIHDTNPQFRQYHCTIDYNQKLDDYIKKVLTHKDYYVFDY